MGWFKRIFFRKKEKEADKQEWSSKRSVAEEIHQAHADWAAAHMKLDWVLEKDQIDCAIYALEAAEKRYEMLLRQAKQFGWQDGAKVVAATMEEE